MTLHFEVSRRHITAPSIPLRPHRLGVRAALAGIAAFGLGAVALPQLTHAQMPGKDTLYDTRTGPSGGCPGMDWHVVVHPDHTLNGVVSWDDFKHMAHVSGTADKNGAFKVDAVGMSGGKAPIVTGTVEAKQLKASIAGTGTACDNQTMNIPRIDTGTSSG